MNNSLGFPHTGIIIPSPAIGSPAEIKHQSPAIAESEECKLYKLYDDLHHKMNKVGLNKIGLAALSLHRKESNLTSQDLVRRDAKHVVKLNIGSMQSNNPILHVNLKSDDEVVSSFLKFPLENPESTTTLERLMWKISKIMKLSDYFVPTKVLKIPFNDGESCYATIQPEIKGKLLGECTKNNQYEAIGVSQRELAMGVFASIIFGMFDAHSYNIMLSDNRIRYFDNGQSLPNSNGFIAWADLHMCRSSYRCGLLDLDGARNPLDPALVEELLEKAKECRSSVENLRAYLKTYPEKSSIKEGRSKLSSYYLEDDSVIESMNQRLDLMIHSLQNIKGINLVELAAKSNPRYLIAFGVEYLAHLNQTSTLMDRASLIEQSNHHHTHISTVITSNRVSELIESGYDLQRVIDLSVDALSFADFVEKLVDYYLEFKNAPKSPIKYRQAIESLFSGVHLDMKEINADTIKVNGTLFDNLAQLKALDIPHVYLPSGSNECFDVPYESFIISVLDKFQTLFAFWTKFGLILRPIDLISCANSIHFDHQEQGHVLIPITREGVEDLKEIEISDPNELPLDPPEGCDIFRYGNRMQITFQDNHLVSRIKDQNGRVVVKEMEYSTIDHMLSYAGIPRISFSNFLDYLDQLELP